MKTILGATALAIALLGAAPAGAQTTAKAKALLLKPLTLTKLNDLDFGTLVASGKPGGDIVTISAVDGKRSSPTATLLSGGTVGQARFGSSGLNNSYVFLELEQPPFKPLKNAAGNELKVEYLVLDGSALRRLTPTSQIFFVGIGGAIYLRPNQEDGEYSGSFLLTATYL